ncbi:MAG: FliM/FliN family flagellar motor switch protein [Isosphaeraceae bacterium]
MSIERGLGTMTPDPELVRRSEPGPPADGNEPLALWSWLPRLSRRQVQLEERLARWTGKDRPRPWLDWLHHEFTGAVELGRPEIVARASGLLRPGLIAQIRWPRLGTRLALGLEVPLAHALVDHLLGYDRPLAESRLQLTPVEWGVWSYLVLRALDALGREVVGQPRDPGNASSVSVCSDLVLDRVGPDAFDPTGLGAITTIRWPVRLKSTTGTARLWLPEPAVHLLLAADPWRSLTISGDPPSRAGQLTSIWRAIAGNVFMPRGLMKLRKGGVLPLTDSRLSGTPRSPAGPIALVCELRDSDQTQSFPAEPVAASGGRLLRLAGPREVHPRPRQALSLWNDHAMNQNESKPSDAQGPGTPSPDTSPTDVPVTLTVELGRVSLTLSRLADLKAGDVIELSRHSREPVELTSGGRIVARGELVLIDTELGVRVTHVFL